MFLYEKQIENKISNNFVMSPLNGEGVENYSHFKKQISV